MQLIFLIYIIGLGACLFGTHENKTSFSAIIKNAIEKSGVAIDSIFAVFITGIAWLIVPFFVLVYLIKELFT